MKGRSGASLAALLFVALAVAVPATVFGGARDLLLCVTGFPGNTDQARPTVRGFLDALAQRAGWDASAVQGDYYPDPRDGLRQIRERRPGFAAMSLDLYLAHGADLGAHVLAKAVMNGRDRQRYHLVVAKEGGPASADALSGKILVPFREEARFFGNLVLDGNRTLAEGLTYEYATDPMSALRKVARGQAVEAVVEENVIARFNEVSVHDQLRVLVEGPWLPASPVVALEGSVEADRTALRDALVGLCAGDGREACRSIRVDSFRAAADADYDEARRLFAR
jgi:hypothetical protein